MTTKKLNNRLHMAKAGKKDEFYTQLTDIEKELKNYKKHFKDKIVLCNCDDPKVSNFFKYFAYNFEKLQLKKLITTCYKSSYPDLFSQHNTEDAVYLEYFGNDSDGGMPDLDNIAVKKLSGNGDFRSPECIRLLEEADIVVTNPPFSLFREYVQQLVEYNKKFLIVGNQNAITYKEIFQLIKENRIWAGVDNGGTKWFQVPDDYEIKTESRIKELDGAKYFSMGSVYWFTNMEHKKRRDELILVKNYVAEQYPSYHNFDAIEVGKVSDIPLDYAGAMGVPITFLDKYNPDQFEIIGLGISNSGLDFGVRPYDPEHREYRKNVQKRGAVNGDLYMLENGEVKVPYARIVIRKRL
jgi:hypothetical protein